MPLASSASRAERYRDIAYRLWRVSTDRSKDIRFEVRSSLARLADQFEDLADRVEADEA
jgi:hypothetical protein